jgi:acetoacetyl-CoA synthetase
VICVLELLETQRLTNIPHGVDEAITIDQFPKFFPGSRLNYAENVLRHIGSRIALTDFTETTRAEPTILSWDELGDKVSQLASAMTASNVKKNDVIACMLGIFHQN